MKEAVIVSAVRTPFGKFNGSLSKLKAVDLGGLVIKEALKRAKITGYHVDEVVYGVVVSAGQGQVPARQASIKGGVPHNVPVVTINKVCGSALKAVSLAAQIIIAGDADVIVAGGMESISNTPYAAPDMRWDPRIDDTILQDAMVLDGLWCPENDVHMAVIGRAVVGEYGVTREMQDAWDFRSQRKWAEGVDRGIFADERYPVEAPGRKGVSAMVVRDEARRQDTSIEALSKLPSLFAKDGAVTAGNAPGTNDGASAIIVMSRNKAVRLGIPVLASIRGYSQVFGEARNIAAVPGLAIKKLMDRYKLTMDNFDIIEINEAFADVPLVSCLGVLGMDEKMMEEKVNPNGGTVTAEPPIGASGARTLMNLLYELKRNGKKSGVCAICSGMAQGDAVWVTVE